MLPPFAHYFETGGKGHLLEYAVTLEHTLPFPPTVTHTQGFMTSATAFWKYSSFTEHVL